MKEHKMENHIESYYQLRNEIDQQVEDLWDQHEKNMVCKKGCDLCCLDFDVFPVELEAIKLAIERNYPEVLEQNTTEEKEGICYYLKDHACTIYSARPIICRTHGFPLLNMNESGDQWELSHCHLNFTDVDEDYFEEEKTFKQDTCNSKLFVLNQNYLKAHPELNYTDFDLLPLRSLIDKK